ncbi:Unknown protein, partial [Striga hermonthica]
FDMPLEKIKQVHSRPPKPPPEEKPAPSPPKTKTGPNSIPGPAQDEMPCTSA